MAAAAVSSRVAASRARAPQGRTVAGAPRPSRAAVAVAAAVAQAAAEAAAPDVSGVEAPAHCRAPFVASKRSSKHAPRRARNVRALRAKNDDEEESELYEYDTRYNLGKDYGPVTRLTSSPGPHWRLFAAVPYFIPLFGSLSFYTHSQWAFPMYDCVFPIVRPLLAMYYSNQIVPFVTFFWLYLGVCRNLKIPHFVRFNVMVSILMDIMSMLGGVFIMYLPWDIYNISLGHIIYNVVYNLGITLALFGMSCALCGCYPEIPIVSEAVYVQMQGADMGAPDDLDEREKGEGYV